MYGSSEYDWEAEQKEREKAKLERLKAELYNLANFFYDGITGQDDVLKESAKPYLRMRFFFCFGFAYSAAQSLLAKQGAYFLEQTLSTGSDDAKLRLLLCIGAIQLIGFAADKIKSEQNRSLSNALDKSSLQTAKGEMGLICDELSINYLQSIYGSIKSWNDVSSIYGSSVSQGIVSLYSLSTVLYDLDSNLFESMLIMQIASAVSQCINLYIDSSRQSSEASLAIIQNRVYELQNIAANHQYTSFQMDIFEKQLNALLLEKKSLEWSISRYDNFAYISKFATSIFYAYSTITAIENAEKGSKHYTNLIFDIQSFLSSLILSSNKQEQGTFNDAISYYNIIAANGSLWFLEEEKKKRQGAKNLKTSQILAEFYKTTKMVDEDGSVKTKKAKVEFEYDLNSAPQSLVLKGENGLGKSCILRAIGGANMSQLDDTSPKPHTYTSLKLDPKDIAYIPQGELTSLTNLTIYKSLTRNNGFKTIFKTFWISFKKEIGAEGQEVLPEAMTNNPNNLAEITPFDIFTVLLTKEQKDNQKKKIEKECIRLITKLRVALPFKTTNGQIDLDKCIEFGNPSGGEQQKFKFIMMAIAARFGDKQLILVDELYNHLDTAACYIIEKEFKKLLNYAPTVKFISTDHRPASVDGAGGLYGEKPHVLQAEEQHQQGIFIR